MCELTNISSNTNMKTDNIKAEHDYAYIYMHEGTWSAVLFLLRRSEQIRTPGAHRACAYVCMHVCMHACMGG